MLKWFDTNYHYLVPEFTEKTTFALRSTKVFDEFKEASALGITTKPVLISPVSFLHLGKSKGDFDKYSLFPQLLAQFILVVQKLSALGAEWVQIDEPILVLDLSETEKRLIGETFQALRAAVDPSTKFLLATYFDDLGINTELACNLPVNAIHIDVTRGDWNLQSIVDNLLPTSKILSLGCIDGRNIWKARYNSVLQKIAPVIGSFPKERIFVSTSCSLIHSPLTTENETFSGVRCPLIFIESNSTQAPIELKEVVSFAVQKLEEVVVLQKLLLKRDGKVIEENELQWNKFLRVPQLNNTFVEQQIANLRPQDFQREREFAERKKIQRAIHRLPLFPTTTIGSLPQTGN
jgi:5-methyltetrahydropteroyltriglutamate--homocysteine methyltransferase